MPIKPPYPPDIATYDNPQANGQSLRINEIFFSIQGEARTCGYPTVFVRLSGCPLRCQYCDTQYAFHQGNLMLCEDIVATVLSYPADYVCVTGGEPLAQAGCIDLLQQLGPHRQVSLETSGALSIAKVPTYISRIVDIKTPGSGEVHRNQLDNLAHLTAHDQLKFVICDAEDYQWTKRFLARHGPLPCECLISPSARQVSAMTLAQWLLQDPIPVRLQIQLHKILFGDRPGV